MMLIKESVGQLLDSAVMLMMERNKNIEDSKDELSIEVDSLIEFNIVLGYFLENYAGQMKYNDSIPLIEKWDFAEGTTHMATFKLFDDFWVSIGCSDFYDEDIYNIADGAFVVDLRSFDTVEGVYDV